MYFDWMYLALVIPAMIFAIAMQALVSSRYTKYGAVMTKRGITGYQAARMVLDSHGLNMVPIEMIAGDLTDNYDPRDNVLHLSSDVYSKASAAAVGIACHEAGHAIQHAAGYFPARVRMAIIPVTNIGSKLSIPLIITGLIMLNSLFIWLISALASLRWSPCSSWSLCLWNLMPAEGHSKPFRQTRSCIRTKQKEPGKC